MYHSIPPTTSGSRYEVASGRFADQMAWLHRAGWRGVSVREALEVRGAGTDRLVALTFDDGYEDNYGHALPILTEYGFTATVFLPTGHVGGTNSWEEGDGPTTALLTWDQAAEMSGAGIEFGSHTVSHLDVRRAGVDAIQHELLESKREIEDRLGTEVVSFAYPYGYFRPEMPELLASTGYEYGLLAGTYGMNTGMTSPYELHRIPVWGEDSIWQFAAKVRGWYWWRYYTIRVRQEARWSLRRLSGGSRRGD